MKSSLSLLPFVSNTNRSSSVLFWLFVFIIISTFLLNNVVNCSASSSSSPETIKTIPPNTNNNIDRGSSSSFTTTTTATTTTMTDTPTDAIDTITDTTTTTSRNPTLPKDGNIQIIFSDLDGTLVHFEKYYKPNGCIDSINEKDGTAVYYKCHQDGSPMLGQTRDCILMPTLTMGPGVISLRTIELINQLRSQQQQGKNKVIFVYISGARKSTMLKRLPLLANADYAIAETGGRIYKLIDNNDDDDGDDTQTQTPVLLEDDEWTTKIEEICGPIETTHDLPLEQRQGLLWDWCRELLFKYNIQSDIRDYTCCFRVDCKKQQQSQQSQQQVEDILRDLIHNNKLPNGISCATNLGKYDFFPSMSGKGNAVKYMLKKLNISKSNAVALFDDENDLDMAQNCDHACVMGCTHISIKEQIKSNKHWNVAKQSGVFATEEILELLLEHIIIQKTKKEED